MATEAPQLPGTGDSSLPFRFLRLWFCVSLLLGLGLLVGVCWYARSYEEIFNQMEMRQLPLPTESLLALGRFVRTTVGLMTVVALGVGLSVLTVRGTFDRVLIRGVVINCIGIALLIPFAYLSLHMPIVQMQRQLEK